MHNKFQQWYAGEVQKQLDQGEELTPVDLRMAVMNHLGLVGWSAFMTTCKTMTPL